jgi:hypothetical protein
MKERSLLLTAALLATANGSLRGPGHDRAIDNLHPSHEIDHSNHNGGDDTSQRQRHLQKKDLAKLKRINAERKRKNKLNRDGGVSPRRDGEEWSHLSKEEKKKLIQKLRAEEKQDDSKEKKDDKQGEEGARVQINPNQLAYLQQYFHHIDEGGMEMNSSPAQDFEESDGVVEWDDFTKAEKKRVKELMDGELKLTIKSESIDDSSSSKKGEGWSELSKQEKKELLNGSSDGEDKGDITQNSSLVGDNSDTEAGDFVIHNRPKPDTLTVDDILNHGSQSDMEENSQQANSGSGGKNQASTFAGTNDKDEEEEEEEEEEEMTQNSQAAGDFVLPMPMLTFGNQDEDEMKPNSASSNNISNGEQTAKNEDVSCPNCFTFASQLIDPSIQWDSFDSSSDLSWSMSGLGWETVTQGCYEGSSCIASGITDSPDHQGGAVYSNLTLTLDDTFDGGVLTFQVKVKDGLSMPNEAFYVTVDDEVKTSPLSFQDEWTEYSVAVGRDQHTVTWSHVYNPLSLESLPSSTAGGLVMDDLRYSPFERIKDQGFEDNKAKGFVMTSDGDAVWKIDNEDSNSGSYSIFASTKGIKQDSGSSNVNFVLYSEEGGILKYKISTSTTAPHDDFAILLNGKPVDAVFGLMPTFDYESLDIPKGKVAVTFQHRKNPGNLSLDVLEALGTVRTKGFTRLDDVRFEPK